MRLSVACNFDPALIEGLAGYPVYEVYGKVSEDYYGGGRPSFYLPSVDRKVVADTVKLCHSKGIEFNYLLNATCTSNLEFTSEGQRKLRETLDWVSDIGVDSITVANAYFLRVAKKCYPNLKARISSHRYTDNPRKARFWADAGADCIVISEINIYREMEALQAIRDSVSCDLSLIVNNSCRQDCAIACSHAVSLNHGSQTAHGKRAMPLDYCFVECQRLKLDEPVNIIRANWIRPEDLPIYERMGFDNFKIVERNSPTAVLLDRVKAYARRRYDGNLMDLVQCYAYPYDKFGDRERDAFSLRRMFRYFFRPTDVNFLRFWQVVELGKFQGLLYPRMGENKVFVDNRALDGFMDRWPKGGCQHIDCETCRYCHDLAERAVRIDPAYRQTALAQYDRLLNDLWGGRLWEGYGRTIREIASRGDLGRMALDMAATLWEGVRLSRGEGRIETHGGNGNGNGAARKAAWTAAQRIQTAATGPSTTRRSRSASIRSSGPA